MDHPQESKTNDREELVIEDREIVETCEELNDNSASFVSRVSDSVSEVEKKNMIKSVNLSWDFPESVDRRESQIIST